MFIYFNGSLPIKSIYSSSYKCVHFYIRFRIVCSCKTDYIILTIQCVYFYIQYIHAKHVIGCKNIHTVLLKLYNQFYMNILHEIVCKNVHTFMKKNIWTPRVFLIFLRFLKEYLISLIA